jgi:hypothetical protein
VNIQARTAANRRRLADFFDRPDEQQLNARSLCDAWTVREVLGHLVMPLAGSLGGFLSHVLRARGSINRANAAVASDLSRRPLRELTSLFRDRADLHGRAPGVGPMGQLADGSSSHCLVRRPVGSATTDTGVGTFSMQPREMTTSTGSQTPLLRSGLPYKP